MNEPSEVVLEYARMLERLKRVNNVAYRYFVGLLRAFLKD